MQPTVNEVSLKLTPRQKQIFEMVKTAIERTGAPPTRAEIAKELGVSLPEYQQLLQESRGAQLFYYEDFHGEGDEDFFDRFVIDSDSNPLELLQDGRFREELIHAIERLPEGIADDSWTLARL